MVESPTTISRELPSEVVQQFVAHPPQGTPPRVIELLTAMLGNGLDTIPADAFISAAEQMPVALSITDLKANILYTNRTFSEVTGYSAEEMIGRNESQLSDQNTPVSLYKALWANLVAGRPWSGTVVNRRRGGQRYLAELLVAPVMNLDGKPIYYLGMHRDVTETHRMEQQLSNQKQLIESVLNAMPMSVVLLDERGAEVMHNSAYAQLGESLSADPLQLLLPGLERETDPLFSIESNRAQVFRDVELSFEPGGGGAERWFACSGSWLAEHDPSVENYFQPRLRHYLLLVVQEITSLKLRAEMYRNTALRALMAEEERAEVMSETITAAGYQLQGPLNLLSAGIGMVQRRNGVESDPLVNVLTQSLEAGREALSLLEHARPTQHYGRLSRLNINQLLRDVVGVATDRLLKEGITIDWRPCSVLPAVNGYEKRLRSLFKRLIDNAIDAISEGRCQERTIQMISTLKEGVIRVSICDSGPGISTEQRLKVFEPFYTTRRASGHAGMGLAVAQEIANQHGAIITLEQTECSGTLVQVELPTINQGGVL